MRHWIDLCEAKVITSAPYFMKGAAHYPIWVNPTLTEISGLVHKHSLRAVTDEKSLFAWRAFDMIHAHGADAVSNAGFWGGETLTRFGRDVVNNDPSFSMFFYHPDTPQRDDEWMFWSPQAAARNDKETLLLAPELCVTLIIGVLDLLRKMPFGRIFRAAVPYDYGQARAA